MVTTKRGQTNQIEGDKQISRRSDPDPPNFPLFLVTIFQHISGFMVFILDDNLVGVECPGVPLVF